MIQVIDIRKHDPERVIEYWKSKGGKVCRGVNKKFPYVGIDWGGDITGWREISDGLVLIDLPELKKGDRCLVRDVFSKGWEEDIFMVDASDYTGSEYPFFVALHGDISRFKYCKPAPPEEVTVDELLEFYREQKGVNVIIKK